MKLAMNAERWKRVDELLQSALEVAPEHRDEFLQKACTGDAALVDEIKSLLTSYRRAGDFLETPAVNVAARAMALSETQATDVSVSGQVISHYRIIRNLGSGGMGIVCEAEDLTLGRRVAVKLLPNELATDRTAFERLQREARSASALDHPNICSIYELGEQRGQPFIVMQLLEGKTVRGWIENAANESPRLRLNQLLEFGIQIADGLEAAHQKGIIHRDIKPANIFITSRGQAKVLDFGLAKLIDDHGQQSYQQAPPVGPVMADAPTAPFANPHLTRTGITMGTAFYMSPEQVRGEQLDERTDIFSLGLVLYEMATGQRAFPADTAAVAHERILHDQPLPMRELEAELPPELEKIVNKALEKERERRYQKAGEIRSDLRQLQQKTSGETAIVVAERRKARTLAAVLVMLISFATASGVYFLLTREGHVPFQNFTIAQITATGKAQAAAISPDGKLILSVQNDKGLQSLWLRNVITATDTQLISPVPERYLDPSFSPDGNYVYFRKVVGPAVRNLFRMPLLAGTPQVVAADVDSNVSFSPDARRMAYIRGNDPELGKVWLLAANPDGGDETTLEVQDIPGPGNNDFAHYTAWSEDGSRIAYHSGSFATHPGVVKFFDLGGKRESLLTTIPKTVLVDIAWVTEKKMMALYSEKGSTRTQIGVISADTGNLQPVTRDTNSYSTLTISADRKTAATVQIKTTGTLELIPSTSQSTRFSGVSNIRVENVSTLAWTNDGNLIVSDGSSLMRVGVDGIKQATLATDPGASILGLATCPNGYILVSWSFHANTEGSSIWRINSDGSNPVQLTYGTHDASPTCSPDGKWAYYIDGLLVLKRVPVGGGRPEIVPGVAVPQLLETQGSIDFSRDGKRIVLFVITGSPGKLKDHLAVVDTDAKSESVPPIVDTDPRLRTGSNFAGGARFTTDGKKLVYPIVDKGVWKLWMQPLDGSPGRQIADFASERITDFRWSPDGKTLAVVRESDTSDVVLLRESNQ
jgi:eukaryotic-like serine/threonine-protein kinase